MNVLLINYEYPPIGGGAAKATWHLATALNESGHHVTVLSAAYRELKGWRSENGVDVFRCRSIRKKQATSTILEMITFVASAALTLPRIMKRKNIEGVIVFFSFSMRSSRFDGLCSFPDSLSDIPSRWGRAGNGTRSFIVSPVAEADQEAGISKERRCFANSTGLKKIAQSTDSIEIHVIPNGVDMDFFQPAPSRQKTEKLPVSSCMSAGLNLKKISNFCSIDCLNWS